MVASGCWLWLSRLHSQLVAGSCELLVGAGFGAGGTEGVQIQQGKVDTGVDWGWGCSTRVALVGSKGGGEAVVKTINRLSAVIGIIMSILSKSLSIFSIGWSQSLIFFLMLLMVCNDLVGVCCDQLSINRQCGQLHWWGFSHRHHRWLHCHYQRHGHCCHLVCHHCCQTIVVSDLLL